MSTHKRTPYSMVPKGLNSACRRHATGAAQTALGRPPYFEAPQPPLSDLGVLGPYAARLGAIADGRLALPAPNASTWRVFITLVNAWALLNLILPFSVSDYVILCKVA